MIKNATEFPTVWYGKHMSAGVAEYHPPGEAAYRILVNEQTIRDMDPTFVGKPVYVKHVDEVNLKEIQQDADGYVVESFFNAADSAHWVKFIIVSDKAREAIRLGFRLSNAYVPTQLASGGISKGVEYSQEIVKGVYEHLALVQDPRYEDSIILSPDKFKEYNENKLLDLKRLSNSKEKRSMFDLFKKSKVEGLDLAEVTVTLPKSGKEVSIAQLINAADTEEHAEHKGSGENMEEKEKQGMKPEEAGAAPQMANMDDHVQVGSDKMSLKDLMASHAKMKDCIDLLASHHAKMNAAVDGGEKEAEKQEVSADKTQRNDEEVDSGEKEAEKDEKAADKTQRNSAHFDALKNAHLSFPSESVVHNLDDLSRGKARYGSK